MVQYIVTAMKNGYRQRIGVYKTAKAQKAKIVLLNKKANMQKQKDIQNN